MTAEHVPWKFFDPEDKRAKQVPYAFWDDQLVDRINIAIALSRPLLLTGLPGVGKSSIAKAVADAKNWGYLKTTIKSRTEADDLKASFDAVRRLSDASIAGVGGDKPKELRDYVTPGVIWRAYAPENAAWFANMDGKTPDNELEELKTKEGRVLLIDEIDKGDLDFANDLLDVFDKRKFTEAHSGVEVEHDGENNLLVVITSNAERDLSRAFRRRCVFYDINPPTVDLAAEIASRHIQSRRPLKPPKGITKAKYGKLAETALVTAEQSSTHEGRLDVATCVDMMDAMLEFQPSPDEWSQFEVALQSFAAQRNKS